MALKRVGPAFAAPLLLLAQAPDFRRDLYPVLERAQCRLCHNDNGVASQTRLQFPGENALAADIDAFGLRLKALGPLLQEKPTNRTPHTGGERIRHGSEEERILRAWVAHLATRRDETVAPAPRATTPRPVRRLTHSQYNHTVRDLLDDQTRPAGQFPKEDFVHGFTNQAEGQSVPPLLAEAYNRAAEKLARTAYRGTAPPDVSFIPQFGLRAFRRPLAPAELRRYEKLFASGGAQLVVEAMLQSPNFLFHFDPTPAARLSYFLWDTLPDDDLFRAPLRTRDEVERAARRMLADPRARLAFDEFLAQWLRFDRLRDAIRDRRIFPEFTPELASAMAEETRLLFNHLVWDNRNFLEFFTADYGFFSSDLALLYGVPAPASEFARQPAAAGRAGILGQATFLTLTSKPADTSPTERGLFIREHFLCQVIPPPPPGVNTNLAPLTDDRPMTNRERLAVHLESAACSGCHRLVDPIGFGFENYDAIGRFRDKQIVTIYPTADEIKNRIKTKPTEHRLAIDTTAFIQGLADSKFATPQEAGRLVARDPACHRCLVKQLFRYALGRPETAADQPAIDAALARFRDSQFRFQELIIAIVTSEPFLGDPR
ncbi:MAG: DUF1592 domain-containing protein [Bryobacteraceae bacterium]